MKSAGILFQPRIYTENVAPSVVTWSDRSRYRNDMALTNVVWSRMPSGMWTAALNANGYGQVAAASSKQVNFTSHPFTVLVWVYSAGIGAAQYIIGQGDTDVDGWGFFVFVNNLSLRLNQGGAHTDISAVNGFAFGRWQMIGVTRSGNTGQFYNNGVAITTAGGGGLANAVSVNGGNKLLVGIGDGEVLYGLTGSVVAPRVWGYSMSATDVYREYQATRRWFGV